MPLFSTAPFSRQILRHLLVRLGIGILLPGIIFGWWALTYDPHKYCTGNEHRHVNGGLGAAIMMLLLTGIYLCALVVESIVLFTRKKTTAAIINLVVIGIVLLAAIIMMTI